MFPSITASCLGFVESDPKELTLDELKLFTLRIFSQIVFGIEMKSEEAELLENFGEMISASVSKVVQQVGLMFFPRLSDFMSFKFMPIHLENYFRSLLNAILNKKGENRNWQDDVIRILNKMRKDGRIHFRDKENNQEETFGNENINFSFDFIFSISITIPYQFLPLIPLASLISLRTCLSSVFISCIASLTNSDSFFPLNQCIYCKVSS